MDGIDGCDAKRMDVIYIHTHTLMYKHMYSNGLAAIAQFFFFFPCSTHDHTAGILLGTIFLFFYQRFAFCLIVESSSSTTSHQATNNVNNKVIQLNIHTNTHHSLSHTGSHHILQLVSSFIVVVLFFFIIIINSYCCTFVGR